MTTFENLPQEQSQAQSIIPRAFSGILANLFPSPWLWLASLLLVVFDIQAIVNGHKFLITGNKVWLVACVPFTALPLAWWLSRKKTEKSAIDRPLRLIMLTTYLMPTMSALAVFNYLAMATAHPLTQDLLSNWDKALGFDWVGYTQFVGHRFWLNWTFLIAYNYMIQALVITICIALIQRRTNDAAELVGLVFFTALTTIAIGTYFPAISAMAYYGDDALKALFPPDAGTTFIQELMEVRGTIPKLLDPTDVYGLTQFPSFHTVCGILTIYGARRAWWQFIPSLAFGTVLIAATPIYGGHYFVDLLAGAAVACFFILLSQLVVNRKPTTANMPL